MSKSYNSVTYREERTRLSDYLRFSTHCNEGTTLTTWGCAQLYLLIDVCFSKLFQKFCGKQLKIWKGENKQNSLSTPLTLSHLLVLFFGSMVGMYVPMNELKECVFLSINISI